MLVQYHLLNMRWCNSSFIADTFLHQKRAPTFIGLAHLFMRESCTQWPSTHLQACYCPPKINECTLPLPVTHCVHCTQSMPRSQFLLVIFFLLSFVPCKFAHALLQYCKQRNSSKHCRHTLECPNPFGPCGVEFALNSVPIGVCKLYGKRCHTISMAHHTTVSMISPHPLANITFVEC